MKKQPEIKRTFFQVIQNTLTAFFRHAYQKVCSDIHKGFKLLTSFLKKRYLFLRDILFINILLFIMILILGLITFNVSFFDPFKQAFKDFSFANVYFAKMNDTTRVDTNIILINTGMLSRVGIAKLITGITRYHPKVIGIDHIFLARKPNDSILAGALRKAPAVVGACRLYPLPGGKHSKLDKSNPYFPVSDYGIVNMPADDPTFSTLRHTQFRYVVSKDTLYSFAAEIVNRYDPDAFERARPWFDEYQIINYSGNQQSFLTIDARHFSDSLADLSIVKGKIVLLGYMGDSLGAAKKLEDIYYTPMNSRIAGRTSPDMYGVVIHANIISMILGQSFIYSVPFFYECVFAFMITFIHLLVIFPLYRSDHKYYELLASTLQYFSSGILLYIYFILFAKTQVSFNMTLTIIGLISMKVVINIYYSIIKFCNRFFIFKTSINK